MIFIRLKFDPKDSYDNDLFKVIELQKYHFCFLSDMW